MTNGNNLPPLRVLLVEDSAYDEQTTFSELRISFRVVLKRVETEAAMQLALDSETWDVVVCDYQLTHFSPYKALELLKASKQDLPFIVMSDTVIESVAIVILAAGAHDFIEKSNPPRLALAIRREIRLAAERIQSQLDIEKAWMQSRLDTDSAYDRTILAWGMALELRDHFTGGHTQRVADLTLRLARRMDIPQEQLVNIHRGALLHDIGKMGVPDLVLLKPGALDDTETAIMRMHPRLAYNMLSPIIFLRGALDIPYCHHEHWDGSGYPRGLAGIEIPLAARIFSVVDVYDALTSDRPYRKSWTQSMAMNHIREQSGGLFDPAVVDKFIEMMDDAAK